MLQLFGILSELEVSVLDEASEAAAATEAATAAAAAATEKAATEKAAAEKAAAEKVTAGGGDKAFTQDDINTALAKQKRESQTENKKIIEELEAIKSKADLTKTERDELDGRIKTMKQANLTKEELARQERLTADSEHEATVTTLIEDRDTWKNRYTQETINRSIVDASVEHDAVHPEQITAILQSKTQLEDEVDSEDNKTGKYVPMVDFPITTEDGQSQILHLTVTAAVKKMREIEKYQNLFNIKGQGGIGQYNRTSGPGNKGQVNMQKLAKDPVAYREARAKEEEAGKT